MGGQLSYTDATCEAQPVTVNEVWYSSVEWPFEQWTQGADAPWSPRRSMASQPDIILVTGFVIMGGLRYLSLRHDAAAARTVLTAAELYADVFICNLALNGSYGRQCDWTAQTGRVNVSRDGWGIMGSLPVPIAAVPQGWNGYGLAIRILCETAA